MTNSNVDKIVSDITQGDFTADDLNKLQEAVRFARAQTARTTKRQLTRGMTVKFTSSKTGRVYSGTVEKVKIKYVLVNTKDGLYNVPAAMLEV
jgi:hypothetical protein